MRKRFTDRIFEARFVRNLRTQTPLDAGVVEYAARDFLDGTFSGVEHWYGVAVEKSLRSAQLVLHLLTRGIAAVRAALAADLLQPFGFDSQRVELLAIRLETGRQRVGFQIVFGERIICG